MQNRQTTVIDPMRAHAMHATLGLAGPPPGPGDPLPEFWHWSQFWAIADANALGRDGHPAMGSFLPETGLPRRMWAGGQITFHAALPIGVEATRLSTAGDVQRKTGRTGPLAFVSVTHEISVGNTLAITERQDLVFREDPSPDAPAPSPIAPPKGATRTQTFTATQADLFRYSALTFNGHRIHYDIDYCRQVEGYPGLIIHGPLLAQRLVDLARDIIGPLASFTFRAVAPVFQPQSFTACAKPDDTGLELWIETQDGLAMTAKAQAR